MIGALRRWLLPRRQHVLGRLLLGLLLLNLLVVGLAVWSMRQSLSKYEDSARTESRNLAQMLQHDMTATAQAIDLALRATVAEIESPKGRGTAAQRPISAAMPIFQLERQHTLYPDLESLYLIDARGAVVRALGEGEVPRQVAGTDYFERLRAASETGLVISQGWCGHSGDPMLVLARAARRRDGTLLGVVAASISLTRFTGTFAQLAVGRGSAFTLFDDQFRIVTRQPDATQWAGKTFEPPQALREIIAGRQEETYFYSTSPLDGVQRGLAYRKLTGMPLHLLAGFAHREYLARWHEEVLKTAMLVSVFVLVTLAMYVALRFAWRRQEAAVAALRQANRTLDQERFFSQAIFQSSPFSIYTRDLQGRITAWNPAAEKLFGWRADEIMGQALFSVPSDRQEESERLRTRVLSGETIVEMEVQRQRRDGTRFEMSTTLAPLRDASGEIDGYLAIVADITARKAVERRVEFLAYRDVLTGLPNRLLLRDRFDQVLAHAARTGTKAALVFLDLDNFKTINDSLGHALGDTLLMEIASRLERCVRDTDTLSRQGGDEFLLVLSDLPGGEAVTPVLAKIREQLQEPIGIGGHELVSTASVGVALYPDDGRDFETLLQKADTAMYQAKSAGRNGYRFFDEQMNTEAVEHLNLKNGLRHALERHEFVLHYQPQIELRTGRLVGAEALLRWRHPEQGLVPPARFIPVAEDSGLIVPIGDWVLHEACRQAVAWRQAGLPELVVAVNLSAVQFRRGDIEASVTQALRATGLEPRLLELELTESTLIENPEQVLGTIKRLKQLGLKLSIDDFGTGYSSLSYLKRFDIDKLKIDQSFVRDLVSDPDDAAIIRAIIQMARSLNLRTIAEGVEDASMLALLRGFECDEVQGYFFARPLPPEELAGLLTDTAAVARIMAS